MDFEGYYQGRAADESAYWEGVRVDQYNTWVRIILRYIPSLLAAASKNPPDSCDWVYMDSKSRVSWRIDQDYEMTWSINLLPDGRLVRVNLDRGGIVERVITLRPIRSQAEEQVRDVSHYLLADLYGAFVGSTFSRFGLEIPPDLLSLTFQNWDSSRGRK